MDKKDCSVWFDVKCDQTSFKVNSLIRHLKTTQGSPIDRILDFLKKESSKV